MKNLLLLFALLSALILPTSCENPKIASMKSSIEAADAACPVNMGIVGDLVSIKYNDTSKEVTMCYVVDESIVPISYFKMNQHVLKKILQLSFSQEGARDIIEKLIDVEVGLKIVMKSSSSGQAVSETFTSDDMRDIRKSTLSQHEILELMVGMYLEVENSKCPYLVDEGIELVKAIDTGSNVIYVYRMDEDTYDMDYLEYYYDDWREGHLDILNDAGVKMFVNRLITLDKGLIYRYEGDTSRKRLDVTFTKAELKSILNDDDTRGAI